MRDLIYGLISVNYMGVRPHATINAQSVNVQILQVLYSIDYTGPKLQAIKTCPGKPEERKELLPGGKGGMAICTWDNGQTYVSDVANLLLESRANAKVIPKGKAKAKGKAKGKAKAKAKGKAKGKAKPKGKAKAKAKAKPAAADSSSEEESSEEEDKEEEEEEEEAEEEVKALVADKPEQDPHSSCMRYTLIIGNVNLRDTLSTENIS